MRNENCSVHFGYHESETGKDEWRARVSADGTQVYLYSRWSQMQLYLNPETAETLAMDILNAVRELRGDCPEGDEELPESEDCVECGKVVAIDDTGCDENGRILCEGCLAERVENFSG